jgi:hypothetical protein
MNDFGEICGPDGEHILVSGVAVPCGNHSKAEEARANGRLFFAAPAMLEALEQQLAQWQLISNMVEDDEAIAATIEASMQLINNALRVARGEE